MVGPEHKKIRGVAGTFEAYHGWNEQAQFPALWKQLSSIHQSMYVESNAYLTPKPEFDYTVIWTQSGETHLTPDIRYNSQRVTAVRTPFRTLGVRAWFTLRVAESDRGSRARQEIALALWCNSTLGMLMHANQANRAQEGRGTGSKGMLETLMTLDVRKLQPWQLEEAQAIWDYKSEAGKPAGGTTLGDLLKEQMTSD